ncbi:hypothetical protein REG_0450 [Candidatus Regiella insecticola LSR1]|uniref:Uncharacterized protein n=1 Tax=Candidatus Regiella insecticola LSR1 TaxID=663321 RepID=E0WR70_9ENTR|nr:hypothetical protein REG_0450 [Candidatus Regiella insecticola LSR1]
MRFSGDLSYTLSIKLYPMNFELRQGGQGDRTMSVDILPDSASTRRQQSLNLKGKGYRV